MTDRKIFIYYKNGDTDSIGVDSIENRWGVDEGLFVIDTVGGEPLYIGNMDNITCIKVENCEPENFPKNKKGIVDSDLRISAGIMREEYRKNPEFRQSVYDSMKSAIDECPAGASFMEIFKAAADRLFGYETDSSH